ncbi:fumarylacetoacetate hydrolase family protein [Maritalea porphyrae]|jgi:fumarylacetoacetate (FAA) hydrolase|uniref:fumarylacetoacetate hydrolase family protein n=1 Tax=Maritalea porphyrae TaxID=880732 RepID=UPI0022AF453A|nr:fumarylacetoacetate hydrolase family protein [Maritalea porphyrae]MCZ4273831.1 fumarylacetoacetate hydrolase family protein [Maritalea porphyrae]
MKLATLSNQSRYGELVVVSRDLTRYLSAQDVAKTMRDAIDNWAGVEAGLQALSDKINADASVGDAFDATKAMAPLPNPSQWADGSAYVNHVELVRKARGADLPASFWEDPLMYMGAPDAMLGANQNVEVGSESWGIDMEAEIGVICDDLPMGISPEAAADKIKLIVLLNDVSYRALIPGELAKGFGFFQSKGATAFAPVAVTPDELGDHWADGKVHRDMLVHYNGDAFGKANAGVDMTFNFPKIVSHAAKTRHVAAGAIIGSGTVSNKDKDGTPGKPVRDGGLGYSCIAEIRMIETINDGAPKTEFMKFGDQVRIEMLNDDGSTIFGAIDQQIVKFG